MKFIIDSNVYIEASSSRRGWEQFERVIIPLLPFTYLSSVVAFELQLSMKFNDEVLLNHHIKALEKVGRLITPSFRDWMIVVTEMKHKKLRSQLCDTLIAQSARNIGALLFTFDSKDFISLSRRMGIKIQRPWT